MNRLTSLMIAVFTVTIIGFITFAWVMQTAPQYETIATSYNGTQPMVTTVGNMMPWVAPVVAIVSIIIVSLGVLLATGRIGGGGGSGGGGGKFGRYRG